MLANRFVEYWINFHIDKNFNHISREKKQICITSSESWRNVRITFRWTDNAF